MLPVTDDDSMTGVCVSVLEPCRVLGVGPPLALIVESDRVERTDVASGDTTGVAAVGRSDIWVLKPADGRANGLLLGLLYFSR